jgi:hypothetical protein
MTIGCYVGLGGDVGLGGGMRLVVFRPIGVFTGSNIPYVTPSITWSNAVASTSIFMSSESPIALIRCSASFVVVGFVTNERRRSSNNASK